MKTTETAISRKHFSSETPMVSSKIVDNCLYTGMFGSLDSTRMASISDKLTSNCVDKEVDFVIVDLGNVDAIDSAVSSHLIRMAKTLTTIGVVPIFCGIRPIMARTMVASGVDLDAFICSRDLSTALKYVLEKNGQKIVPV